jgi:prepilin-type N-terminal cleavage/methylation domain-containing protein
MRSRKAFTLIELLTVLAITAVLLTLIVYPVIRSFDFVRTAQGFADAQDKARSLIERISREISNSAAVRDNFGRRGEIAVVVPGENGTPVTVSLPYAKLDIVKPAEGDPTLRGPGGAFINPKTGREDPTLNSPLGQVVLPVTPGNTIRRYFIGLRDPFLPYTNPYDGLLMARSGQRDNLFVLYMIEVQPYIWANGRYVVNNEFFFDQDRDADPATSGPLFDDPGFFDPNVALPGYTQAPFAGQPADPTKADMVRNWRNRARIVTEVSRYDMVVPLFNRQTRRPIYDNNVPRLIPLVQFKPTSIGGEATEGMAAVRLGTESDNMQALSPDVYRTRYGAWSKLLVRMFPAGFNPQAATSYNVGAAIPGVDPTKTYFTVLYYDPTVMTSEIADGIPLFNSDFYLDLVRQNARFPFSQATVGANLNATTRPFFVPFVADMQSGKLITSFAISELGDPNQSRVDLNPTQSSGQAVPFSTDPSLGGNWNDPIFQPSNASYQINQNFNKIWREQTTAGSPINYNLLPNIHRFIDLRVVPFSDGTDSPLYPDPARGFARARIVPGSEIVTGPDQNPGPNFGQPVRYTRVTREPGPNQYRINYVDLPEPTNPVTNAVDYSVLAPGLPNPPAIYDPNDFTSAIIQPRFKAGYIQLNSDPNVPLPGGTGNITVSYRFQFNGSKDIFTADYDSRQLMGINLTIRNYPQSTNPNPQMVTLKGAATVRNVLR